MSTRIGKVLVFVNLFVAFGLAAWAVALYANRPAYFDATGDVKAEGQFTKFKKEVDELNTAMTLAQANYSQAAAYTSSYEATRDFRNNKLTARLNAVRKGDDANILFREQVKLLNDKQFAALIDVNRDGGVVKGVRDTPLQGLGYLTSEMRKSVLEESTTRKAIEEARRKLEEVSARIQNRQDETFAQKVIRKNLFDQKSYLGDVQTNWDEQLKLLERRKLQLADRLAAFGATQKISTAGDK